MHTPTPMLIHGHRHNIYVSRIEMLGVPALCQLIEMLGVPPVPAEGPVRLGLSCISLISPCIKVYQPHIDAVLLSTLFSFAFMMLIIMLTCQG